MTGRGVTKAQAKSWATGQVWRAAEAEELGLIDGVMTFEGALSGIRGEVKARDKSANAAQSGRENRAEVTEMSESTQSPAVPVAASFEELEASLVGADAGFIVSQLKAKATLDEAKGAWMAELVERSKAADERAAKAEESANRGTSRPGNAPVGRRGSESDPESQDMGGSATDRWNGLVASIMKRDNCAKRDAVKKARREDEDLALAFTREYDAEHSALKKRG
jgi:enoyl-CoA hydratase/carnithine racemase